MNIFNTLFDILVSFFAPSDSVSAILLVLIDLLSGLIQG